MKNIVIYALLMVFVFVPAMHWWFETLDETFAERKRGAREKEQP
jgi:hypothetical protein